MKISLLDEIREKNPVVLNISNFVTVQDVPTASTLLGRHRSCPKRLLKPTRWWGLVQQLH